MNARDAMIDSAIALFRERGIAATSLRDVVEHSGAPRGSIYHHFPDGKDQLAAEATARAGAFIGSLLEVERAPAETVRRFVDHWCAEMRRNGFDTGCPAAAAALGSETPSARTAAGASFASWQSRIAGGLTRHGRSPEEAGSLAALIVAAIEGALILCRAQASEEPLRAVGRQLEAVLAT